MGYGGYLIKIGEYTVPFEYILSSTYSPNIKGQDLDSYTDENGILHRNALKNKVIKIEWETPSMDEAKLRTFADRILSEYVHKVEKKCLVTAYMPELGKYVTMPCYVPDIEYKVSYADEKTIEYDSFRIAFIGYGGEIT